MAPISAAEFKGIGNAAEEAVIAAEKAAAAAKAAEKATAAAKVAEKIGKSADDAVKGLTRERSLANADLTQIKDLDLPSRQSITSTIEDSIAASKTVTADQAAVLKTVESTVKTAGDVQSLTGKSLSAVKKALDDATSFCKKNPKTCTAAAAAAGLAYIMLVTGEADPAKALGQEAKELGAGVGGGINNALTGVGDGINKFLGDISQYWWVLVLVLCLPLGIWLIVKLMSGSK